MDRGELVKLTPASEGQIARWIENGVKIGGKSKGPGYNRPYDEIDVKVCTVLAPLSPLVGYGRRVPASKDILKKVATQVRKEPSIADRDHIFVSTTGVITEEPKEGWVVSTGSRRGNT